MDLKFSNSRYKQKLLIFLSALFIALLLQPTQIVHADWADAIAAYINSTYDNNAVGTSEIQNGVSVSRTGYLAYMVNKETGAPTSDAKAFYAGENWIAGSQWIVSSRHGGLNGGGGFTDEAFWGKPWIPPEHKGDPLTSLEPNIKEWFRTKGSAFVDEYFPANHSNFVADTEVLVLETIMNCQFSSKSGGNLGIEVYEQEANRRLLHYTTDMLIDLAADYGYPQARKNYYKWYAEIKAGDTTNFDNFNKLIADVHDNIKDAIVVSLMANGYGEAGNRIYYGSPVIGTVPNLLKYDQWNTTVFDSYLNDGAPHAEKIEYSEAGFEAYSGSGTLSDAEVQQYGVAMMIIHCKDPAQTTCDEPLIPSPHDPPKESDGKITIVKSYREKINGEEKHVATTSRSNLGTQIIIENEQTYQVVGWKTSTTTNTGITSTPWNPPGSVVQQGTTPKSVTLQPTETCLYVLLEKVEEEPPEEEPWNYHLTQSQITRCVWFSNPDRPLDNMGSPFMYEREITWIAPAHQECHEHYYWTACDSKHSCSEVNCKVLNCPDDGSHNCGDDCVKNTEHCTGWKWKPGTEYLKLSINNTLQESYPDILATKVGWNVESRKGELTKHHYLNDSQFLRESETMQTYTDTGWDYVCVLLRGKDKLTVADWQNNGDGNNAKNDANTDLLEVSPPPSRFKIANTDSGTRKTVDYYETFNTTFAREEHGVEGTDNETVWYPTIPAPVTGELCADDQKQAYVAPPLHINDIVVKVETYSGTAAEHKNDTTCDDRHLTHDLPDYNTSSGRMVKSGSIVSFTPYIEMKYDTLDKYDKQAFVLSEFTAQLTPNDYGELSWNRTDDSNLSLISAQWSTHADAIEDIKNIDGSLTTADNVLPGGATLSLNIKKDARQEVAVTTWQCILEGTGKTHVEKTGGSYGNLTRENAVSAHQSFVATVQAALESTNVQQYVEEDPKKPDAFSTGLPVNPGVNISSLGTGAQTASIEAKYYFRDDNTDSPSNEGDLDVNNLGTSRETYTFFACTHGHIHLSIGNTSPKISKCNCSAYPIAKDESIGQLINKRTLIIDKLEAALEQGTGSDGTIHSGPQWYNEAFDGITVIMQQTILEVGYNDPPERSSVLDPKLTPKQTSQKSLFKEYFLSQFKTQNHSAHYNEPYIMGEFKNAKVKLKDMDYLFHSRKFWIPNATTQDLH